MSLSVFMTPHFTVITLCPDNWDIYFLPGILKRKVRPNCVFYSLIFARDNSVWKRMRPADNEQAVRHIFRKYQIPLNSDRKPN